MKKETKVTKASKVQKDDKSEPQKEKPDLKRRRIVKVARRNSIYLGQIKNQITNFLNDLDKNIQGYIDENDKIADELDDTKVKRSPSEAQSRKTSKVSSQGFNGDVDEDLTVS